MHLSLGYELRQLRLQRSKMVITRYFLDQPTTSSFFEHRTAMAICQVKPKLRFPFRVGLQLEVKFATHLDL